MIEVFGLGEFLTKRDAAATRLTEKYLIDHGSRQWRTATPELNVPVQPQTMDLMQREMLSASVNLDPHPDARDPMRTRDIRDPQQAKEFVRTQVAKHLEHYFASDGNAKVGASLSAINQPASPSVSPSRIDELRSSNGQSERVAHRP